MVSDNATLLAIFAHPDDEVFRCGGTLALLSRRGVRIQVLTATRGQAGSCGDPPLCSPQELGAVREAELRCACRALGILPPRLLDYQDGVLAEVNETEAVAQIMGVLRELRPQVLLTWPPHGLSGHPDHIVVSCWATRAFERAAAEGIAGPLALYHLAVPRSIAQRLGLGPLRATPDEQIAVTVDVGAAWEQKLAAIRCHRTQLGESPILAAPTEQQRLFLGTEHFQRAAARYGHDFLLGLSSSQSSNCKAGL
jgi:LmbE family N-acetylglucosaminyl deacetylase